MITFLDPSASRFLDGLNLIQQRAQRAQRELTTGLRINTVSDAPEQITDLIQTRSDLDRAKQIDTNLARVKTEVDSAESGLQAAVKLVERAQTLASQGQSSTTSPQARQALAGELTGVLQQLVSISQTSVNGRYIFSGDSDQNSPYTLDLTQANPVSSYLGSPAMRQIQLPDGSLASVSKTAQEIFDGPDGTQNVFLAVNNLREALLNNDQAGIDAALPNILSAGTYLNTQLAFYGTVQNRVNTAVDSGSTLETQLQVQISNIQDADEAKSITELTQAQTQQQAALASRAKLPMTSLFNFLG